MNDTPIQPRSIPEIAARYPAFSQSSLRWAIFNADAPRGTRAHEIYSGLKPAIIRVGRRVLIDESAFLNWVAAGRQS